MSADLLPFPTAARPPEVVRADIREEVARHGSRMDVLLAELDGRPVRAGAPEGVPTATRARPDDDEMVEPGWAAKYVKLSKGHLKKLAKKHGFGWLVGGRIKIHKGRFFAYILSHRPEATGR